MPPINPVKVRELLATLNVGRETNPVWIEITDTYAPMEMIIGAANVINFNVNKGFPFKMFKNLETFEIKIYDARKFTP